MMQSHHVDKTLTCFFDKPATGSIYNGTDQNLVVCI